MKKPMSRVVALAVCLIVMSVTTFLVEAQKPVPPRLRFVDNLDGTITDNKTGLIWEKKTGSVGPGIVCSALGTCPDPSDVNNRYVWSATGSAADGPLFTDFLAKLNCTISTNGTCVSPYTDWRVPTVAELRTIVTPNCVEPGPCIEAIFGPTQRDYWSSTTSANPASDPPVENNAWDVDFVNGTEGEDWKGQVSGNHVRAVRRGR